MNLHNRLGCVYNQILLNFPQDEANKIKKEASDLDKLIDKTEKEYNDLREDLRGKETEVRKLLEKGKTEQQVHEILLLCTCFVSAL